MVRGLLMAMMLWLGLAPLGSAQGVLVAPHAVIIDHKTRSSAITLYNPGAEPAEVSVSTFFGFPVTDSVGDFELATPPADPRSAAAWIEAYPRRMVIGPLERQTVRLLARPPAALPDGEFWSRVMITAKGGKAPVVTADTAPAGITVGLNLEVRTVIPLQYRKGTLGTGVQVDPPRVVRQGDSLVVRTRMTRDGNAAFVGTARGTLLNDANQPVASFVSPLAVYTVVDPRFAIGVAGLPAGRYRLQVELKTERADLPPELILRANPVVAEARVTLP